MGQDEIHDHLTIPGSTGPTDPQHTGSRQQFERSESDSSQRDRRLPFQTLGRYQIISELGSGGFGTVYRARDPELNRDVAIKVPHAHLVARPENVNAYLTEARTLASLDHPHIVPVYDVGRTQEGLCYVVSKFIVGCDLASKLRQMQADLGHHAQRDEIVSRSETTTFRHAESAELIATVAGALHYAHRQGLVHRDIKPGNILIDSDGKPYVVDFGLALREEDFGKGHASAGTPPYMSPEQARGEGHRVDGRSDVFSLGSVFYELLTGRRPFRGDTALDVQIAIIEVEPRPPRQLDDSIPKELERSLLRRIRGYACSRNADFVRDSSVFWAAGDPSDLVFTIQSKYTSSSLPAAFRLEGCCSNARYRLHSRSVEDNTGPST